MLPGLSSFVLRQRRQTDWLYILQDVLLLVKFAAKLTLFFQYDPYIYPVGAYLSREYCLFLQFLTILFVIFWLLSTLYKCSGFICCAGP